MRIAYDYQIFGEQKYGGISRYFFELISNISKISDTEVGIVSPLYVNAYLAAATTDFRIYGRKIPSVRHTGRIVRAINQLLTPSALVRFHPDLVHETYYSKNYCAPAGSKVVLTVFDMINERFPESFTSRDPTSRFKAIAVERADHVICISEQTRRDLVELLDTDPAKISVVHLGFTLTRSAPAKDEHRIERPYLLYVGKRGGYKNFSSLLRAYAAKPELRHTHDLIAFGGDAFNAQEKDLMRNLGILDEKVRQVGGDDSVLAGLYRQASLFVYPSLYEGFGIPPLEAMSFDCPVVCSNTSSIPEVVGDAAELFDPNSTEALIASIERILNDKVLRQTLVMRGRERIKIFSWERCAQQTMDVYRGLVE
ncbi:MAG: glycosyltransferase family 4 protein [Thiobacillus sp.]